jgi:hypothetical protein
MNKEFERTFEKKETQHECSWTRFQQPAQPQLDEQETHQADQN